MSSVEEEENNNDIIKPRKDNDDVTSQPKSNGDDEGSLEGYPGIPPQGKLFIMRANLVVDIIIRRSG